MYQWRPKCFQSARCSAIRRGQGTHATATGDNSTDAVTVVNVFMRIRPWKLQGRNATRSRRRSQADLALERWREVDHGRRVRRDRIAQQHQATALLRELLERLRQSSGEGLGSRHRLVLVDFARTGLGHQLGELL